MMYYKKKVIEVEKLAVQQIHQALKDNPNDVAALIVETIQGEGGDNHFRPEFLKELRKIADENEFLLILMKFNAVLEPLENGGHLNTLESILISLFLARKLKFVE